MIRSDEKGRRRLSGLMNLAAAAGFRGMTGMGLRNSQSLLHDRIDRPGAFSAAGRAAKARIHLARMARAVRTSVETGADGGVRKAVAGTDDHEGLCLERLKNNLLSTT